MVAVPVRESGAELLRVLLDHLVAGVAGAAGAAVAVSVAPARPLRPPGAPPDTSLRRDGTVGRVDDSDAAAQEALLTGRPVLGPQVVAVPGPGADGDAVVVTLWLDRPPEDGDAEALEHALPVLTSAVTVVEYCAGEEERAAQMVQMVQYRRVIEQAKGVVMAATGTAADAAFATLARGSQHFNVRLRNLAVALVELVGGAPAEGPDDPAAAVTPTPQERYAAEQVWAALSRGPRADAGGAQ